MSCYWGKKTKEKKRGCRSFPDFWLFYVLGLYSLLFVCFNKHTRTRVKKKKATLSNCVCKFMFGQKFSFSNCTTKKNLSKGSLMEEKIKTDQRFARVGRVLRCHRACHVTPSKYHSDRTSSSHSSNQSKDPTTKRQHFALPSPTKSSFSPGWWS